MCIAYIRMGDGLDHFRIVDCLLRTQAFQNISRDQQNVLADIAEVKEFPKNSFLVLEKEKSNHLFVIVKGVASVEIALPGSPNMESVAKLTEGDVFGEFGLLGVDRRSASVRATDDMTCLLMSHEKLLELCKKDHELGFHVMGNIARTLADRLITTTRDFGNAMYQMVFTGKK